MTHKPRGASRRTDDPLQVVPRGSAGGPSGATPGPRSHGAAAGRSNGAGRGTPGEGVNPSVGTSRRQGLPPDSPGKVDLRSIAMDRNAGNQYLRPVLPPTSDDLRHLRDRLGVPNTQTVAVGTTDVRGLEQFRFEGASPKVREEAGISSLDQQHPGRGIRSPAVHPQGKMHAEEDLVNQFDRAVLDAKLSPEDVEGNLYILQSNPTGACTTCFQGFPVDRPKTSRASDVAEGVDVTYARVPPGILKQLSDMYPNLTIHLTSEVGDSTRTGGRLSFAIRDGEYVN